MPRFWLMKSEPSVYSIDDLRRDGRTRWNEIRNYLARNYMTTDMKPGDLALFYHSSAEPPGVAGLMRISAPALPDETQFDDNSDYFEPRATRDKPVWFSVEVEFVEKARAVLPLDAIRAHKPLARMELLRKGQRLSIQPVTPAQLRAVCALAGLATRLPTGGRARG